LLCAVARDADWMSGKSDGVLRAIGHESQRIRIVNSSSAAQSRFFMA
jgi:hypothetical protein